MDGFEEGQLLLFTATPTLPPSHEWNSNLLLRRGERSGYSQEEKSICYCADWSLRTNWPVILNQGMHSQSLQGSADRSTGANESEAQIKASCFSFGASSNSNCSSGIPSVAWLIGKLVSRHWETRSRDYIFITEGRGNFSRPRKSWGCRFHFQN